MIRALEVDTGLDLRPFLGRLRVNGIRHKVTEESGRQVLWVANEHDAGLAVALMAQWRQDGEPAGPAAGTMAGVPLPAGAMMRNTLQAFFRAPVTMILIALCLAIALISSAGGRLEAVLPLFYPSFSLEGNMPVLGLLGQINSPGVALRTLTPALLHFGVIHLVFNLLWLWYLGSMIETLQSSWRYLGLVVFAAFAGNTAQYFSSYSVNFGGMSGVVYALLGYIWIWQTLCRNSRLRLPPSMIGFFLLALVLMEVFASSWIASAAHVGGLVSGMLTAAVAASYERLTDKGRTG